MVTAKLAFVLIQVGSNLWVNPMQLPGIKEMPQVPEFNECRTLLISFQSDARGLCSDWSINKVREALSPINVSRAMESK